MSTENGRKESYKRPNILRKRNLGNEELARNIEFVEVKFVNEELNTDEEMTLEDLTTAISLDSYLCDEYKKRKEVNETLKPCDNVLFLSDISTKQISLNRAVFSKQAQETRSQDNNSSTGTIISSGRCQPLKWTESLDKSNSVLDNISVLQDQWIETGENVNEDPSLTTSMPLLQVECGTQLSQDGEGVSVLAKESFSTDGVRLIACPWPSCERTFRQPCRLREHWRAHTGARPYYCKGAGCRAAFRSASKLRRHIAGSAHGGERRHACPWPSCDRVFLRADHLRQHVPRHVRSDESPVCETAVDLGRAAMDVGSQSQETKSETSMASKVELSKDENLSRPIDPVLLQWQHHSLQMEEGVGCARTHRPWSGTATSTINAGVTNQCWSSSANNLNLSLPLPDQTDWLATLDLPMPLLPDEHTFLQEDGILLREEVGDCGDGLASLDSHSLGAVERHPLFDPVGPY